jgi:CheY-like chemotaxis protein
MMTTKRLHILLIDDDPVANFIHKVLLLEKDIVASVETRNDGIQGLEYLLRHCSTPGKSCPDLIIFDHNMPMMDGLEMIRRLRRADFFNAQPCVFMLLSIYVTSQEKEMYQRLGVIEFSDKPLTYQKVLLVYRKYFSADTGTDFPDNH